MTADNSMDGTGRAPAWPVVAVIAASLLFGLYVGAYLALARPMRSLAIVLHEPNGRIVSFVQLGVPLVPSAWEPWFQRAFTPLEAVDRRLRPELWETH
jgi:hypothetical protein